MHGYPFGSRRHGAEFLAAKRSNQSIKACVYAAVHLTAGNDRATREKAIGGQSANTAACIYRAMGDRQAPALSHCAIPAAAERMQ